MAQEASGADSESLKQSLSAVQNAFTVLALTRRAARVCRSLSVAISVKTSLRPKARAGRCLSFPKTRNR